MKDTEGLYILDDDGNPRPAESLEEYHRQWPGHSTWTVGQTEVGEAFVSTVFLGSDHNFARFGRPNDPNCQRPLLFETAILGGPHDGYQARYATRAEALAGHTQAVKLALGEGE